MWGELRQKIHIKRLNLVEVEYLPKCLKVPTNVKAQKSEKFYLFLVVRNILRSANIIMV